MFTRGAARAPLPRSYLTWGKTGPFDFILSGGVLLRYIIGPFDVPVLRSPPGS